MSTQQDLHSQYQTLVTIWGAILVSEFAMAALLWILKPEIFTIDLTRPFLGENAIFVAVAAILAIQAIVFSRVLPSRYLRQAAYEQKTSLVALAVITGAALSESVVLMGMFLAFAFNYPYFYIWFAAGILATALGFPRRSDLEAANIKKP